MFSWFVTNRALRNEIRQYRQEIEELRLEWNEWFDKFRRLYARLSRRVEREAEQPEPDEHQLALVDPTAGGLTPEQRAANDRILARRRR